MNKMLSVAQMNANAGMAPFSAIVARGDEIIAIGRNGVLQNKDPTAHGEV